MYKLSSQYNNIFDFGMEVYSFMHGAVAFCLYFSSSVAFGKKYGLFNYVP